MTLSYWKLSGQKAGQSGLWGSKTLLSTFQTLMAAIGEGEKKKGWIDVDWTWMALSSVLDSMPDRKEPASILEKNTVVVVSSLSKVNLWYFCVLSHLLWSWIFAGFSGSLHFSCTLQKWHSGATFLNNRPYLDDTSHKILNSIFCAAATKKNKHFSGLTRNISFGCQRCNNI